MSIFKVNLEEKLIKAKQKKIEKDNNEIKQSEDFIKSAKEIINSQSEEDLKALERAGLAKAVNQIKNTEANNSNKNNIIKDNRIFTLSEIKSIAIQYGLRFLPSDLYKGNLPNDLGMKIREFENSKYSKKLSSIYIRNVGSVTYFILAPTSNFKLQQRPKDPLMFAYLSNGTYYLIHKWGSDLNIGRYILNLFNRTLFIKWLTVFSIVSAIVFGIQDYFWGYTNTALLLFIPIVIVGLLNLLCDSFDSPRDSFFVDIYGKSNKTKWNDPYID
jgi:hypothetical protein